MRNIVLMSVAILALAFPAVAQDAQVGKEYDVTIETEDNNQYVGAYGQAEIGSIDVLIPNAKKDQKYHLKVTDIKLNQYTGYMQASCEFQQTGGNAKGKCIDAP